jgi:hypothetical protein
VAHGLADIWLTKPDWGHEGRRTGTAQTPGRTRKRVIFRKFFAGVGIYGLRPSISEGETAMRDHDRTAAFEKFMGDVNKLLADERLREVLQELDKEGEEAFDLLAPDPAAFLRYRGVEIPADYRITVEQRTEEAARGTTTTAYCLRICWWRWCITICIIVTRKTTTA